MHGGDGKETKNGEEIKTTHMEWLSTQLALALCLLTKMLLNFSVIIYLKKTKVEFTKFKFTILNSTKGNKRIKDRLTSKSWSNGLFCNFPPGVKNNGGDEGN